MNLEGLKKSCPRIDNHADNKVGSGFLITPNVVATASHVVGTKDNRVQCSFGAPNPSTVVDGTVLASAQPESDHALIRLDTAVADLEPLPLCADCDDFPAFIGFGYPGVAQGAGLVIHGTILDAHAVEPKNRAALQLESPAVAAGMATPIHGFSGTGVVVDGAVVGHLWQIISDRDNPGRPAFGLIYAAPADGLIAMLDREHINNYQVRRHEGAAAPPAPGDVSKLRGVAGPPAAEQATPAPALDLMYQFREASTPQLVSQLLATWERSGLPREVGRVHAAQRLIDLGLLNDALVMLDGLTSLRAQQLRALALDRAGHRAESLALLKQLRREQEQLGESAADLAETRGLLAGRYKRQWQDTHTLAYLVAAHELYADAYKRTNDPYPGINAAATALYMHETEESRRIAREIADRLSTQPESALDFWERATLGEAYLLLGDLAQAKQWYAKAVALDPDATQSRNAMLDQARRDLEYIGLPTSTLDAILA